MNSTLVSSLHSLRVTAKSFGLFSIVSITAVVVSDTGEDRSVSGFLSVFTLGVIVTLLTAATIFPLQWVIGKTEISETLKACFRLLGIIVAGGLRGYVLFELSEPFGFDSVTTQTLRVFNSAVTTVIWLVIISIATQAQFEYRQQLEALLRQAMLKKYAAISDETLRREIGEIEQELKTLGFNKGAAEIDAALLLRAAQEVRKLISTSIRPLSHRLWLDTQSAIPRIKLKALFIDAIRNLDYSIYFVLAIYFLLSTVNLNSAIGIVDALSRTFAGSIMIVSSHLIFTRVVKPRFMQNLATSALFLLSVGISGALLTVLADESWSVSQFDLIYLLVIPYAPAIIILQSMARMVVSDRNQILLSLGESMRSGVFASEVSQSNFQTSQIASYLHNSLQTELTSIASQLEAAAESGDYDESRRTMERLGAMINRSISDDFSNFYRSPIERLDHVVEAWRGILKISLDVPEECLLDDSRNILLVQYIEEVASNAIRFGEATEMSVEMRVLDTGTVRMKISNNGKITKSENFGIGKKWIFSNSLNTPRITSKDNGFEIIVDL